MNDLIYILLPVHNRRNITQRFIECLQRQRYSDYHLVLIDDGSTDGTEQMVRERIDNLTVLKGKGNWWWAGSLQQGVNWLKKEDYSANNIVLMINDDVLFDPFFLENAISIMKKKSRTLLLAQLIDNKTGETKESGVNADLKRQKFHIASSPEEINCLSTRGLFLRFADLLKIGGFHPHLLPHYRSDYEFTTRAHRKGFSLCTTPDLAVYPDEEQTGLHKIYADNFMEYLSNYFSKRYVDNPFYSTMFIVLTAPKLYVPHLVIFIWGRALISIAKWFWLALRKHQQVY